jgi:hypothetical protein
MVGFMDPVGTIYQFAMDDSMDVAMIRAVRMGTPHPFQ